MFWCFFACSGFELLDSADQSILLSSSSVEVMFLLLAQQFSENPSLYSSCKAALFSVLSTQESKQAKHLYLVTKVQSLSHQLCILAV